MQAVAAELSGAAGKFRCFLEAGLLSHYCDIVVADAACWSTKSPSPLSFDLTSSFMAGAACDGATKCFRGPSVCAMAAPPIPAVSTTSPCGSEPPTSMTLYFFPGSSPVAAICRLSISPSELIETLACATEWAVDGG